MSITNGTLCVLNISDSMASRLPLAPPSDFLFKFEKSPKILNSLPSLDVIGSLNSSHGSSCFVHSSIFMQSLGVRGGQGRLLSVVDAAKEEGNESSNMDSPTSLDASSKVVLVVGGTGGVGQLIVASLLKRNVKACLLLRDPDKATSLFGKQDKDMLRVWKGDTRNPEDLDPSIFEGVTHVICCTGTTAFPSKRWEGDNTPEKVDWEGVRNLVSALPPSIHRIVLVSSIGVTKSNELPWSIMNLFGVLKYKKMGEDILRDSGLPFTIVRPGRLTDGPYTSYDLNTLLKATAGKCRAVLIDQGDKIVGETSRIVVAEACIQLLDIDFAQGEIYEINSIEGEGPGSDPQRWRELFRAAKA